MRAATVDDFRPLFTTHHAVDQAAYLLWLLTAVPGRNFKNLVMDYGYQIAWGVTWFRLSGLDSEQRVFVVRNLITQECFIVDPETDDQAVVHYARGWGSLDSQTIYSRVVPDGANIYHAIIDKKKQSPVFDLAEYELAFDLLAVMDEHSAIPEGVRWNVSYGFDEIGFGVYFRPPVGLEKTTWTSVAQYVVPDGMFTDEVAALHAVYTTWLSQLRAQITRPMMGDVLRRSRVALPNLPYGPSRSDAPSILLPSPDDPDYED